MEPPLGPVAVALVAVAVAGCLSGPGAPDDPAGSADLPDGTVLYRPGPDGIQPATPDLLDGVPAPEGLARYTGGEAFEPTIGVTPDGTIAFSSATFGDGGVNGIGDYTSVMRSRDQGRTWEDVTPQIGPVSSPPQTNDPYVHVDAETGRIFALDMQGLQCNWLTFSDDEGDTWTSNPVACGQPPLEDHPTLWTGPARVAVDEQATANGPYPNVVYLCVNRLVDTGCARSLDGGLTFGPYRPLAFHGCGGLTGHGVSGPDGRIYIGTGTCGDHPTVAISEDDALTWEVVTVTEAVDVAKHDVELATDAAGNVYAMWIDSDLDPYLAVSTDHGRTWSDPVTVAPPGVETAEFPAIAAGEAGRVAMIFHGTDATGSVDRMSGDVTWDAYIATVLDATAEDPVVAATRVNPADDPVARGPCDDENRCDGIGDFLDVVVGPDGRPWAAFIDVCDAECVQGRANHGVRAFAGTLGRGPALRGDLGALPPLAG